jgi:hypothetical protein
VPFHEFPPATFFSSLISRSASPPPTSSSLTLAYPGHPLSTDIDTALLTPMARHCRNCDKEATLKCGRCNKVIYCDSECQEIDWTKHKTVCNKIEDPVVIISRAAELLQRKFYTFREMVYDTKVLRLEERGKMLLMHVEQADASCSLGGHFIKFPSHLVRNDADNIASSMPDAARRQSRSLVCSSRSWSKVRSWRTQDDFCTRLTCM